MKLAQELQEQEDNAEAIKQVEAEDSQKDAQSKGEPISKYVKQDLVAQIVDMGFSKDASEKALFMTMA